AINAIPAVVGATLVGIDKSNQNGHNWALGCEEWFNRRPDENVYLNNYVSQSGDDWWYALMPNVFFYQLYDLYPGTGDFDFQLTSVADQWLKAVVTMGGGAAPWHKPSMNYRGWYLSTMKPYTSGVTEPEAAGAIAWLLYNAYVKTENAKYRIGAEWCLEFLNSYSGNPSYELQLPYGVYAAARMNAELGATYDIEKMVNWCFDPENNVRQWGVTLGKWGNYDCHGLVGEALNDGYAFAMNGFEMAGALVPMLRYDSRFARAIGKWMLNLANASRLFYSPFLPDSLQDGEVWAKEYDPEGYIAHESMREYASYTGVSPFATGDAIAGGWGATNFTLYGSSHVGILGGIIDTTNIIGILKLDLRKTDYFQEDAYPSYLFYNPYDEVRAVAFDAGAQTVDLYDAVSKTFLATGISGATSLNVPADEALLIVLAPAGGTVSYKEEKMLVNDIVVDYHSGQTVANYAPRIKAIASDSTALKAGRTYKIYCTATDRDADDLHYSWKIGAVGIGTDSSVIELTTPENDTTLTIYCQVSDGVNPPVADSVQIQVYTAQNQAPIISRLTASARRIAPMDTTELHCSASDPDSDSLIFVWSTAYGILQSDSAQAVWQAPDSPGYFSIKCTVSDRFGGLAADSILIVVGDTSSHEIGVPAAYYPFAGNADDQSGQNNHGTVNGADLTANRFGNPNSAYYFNGTSDNIRVPNSVSLNFTKAITVSFWMNPATLYADRESYPISHGNWENRWKISIIPQKKIRWTVKTTTGVKDLDSDITVNVNQWYHVVGLYDGANFDLYVDGELSGHTTFSGDINTTSIDLMIGQCLPAESQYNFKGVIDDVRIYDYALSIGEISKLFSEPSAIRREAEKIPTAFQLSQNFPNPFNPVTTIKYDLPQAVTVKLQVFDLSGRLVQTLIDENKPAGHYSAVWNAQNVSSGIYFIRLSAGDFTAVKKCVKLK
ncbi:MAG: LamG-like jellyroll fold domain-containing protein, partial [Candidatus Neomarinimicrobiota bacterium]